MVEESPSAAITRRTSAPASVRSLPESNSGAVGTIEDAKPGERLNVDHPGGWHGKRAVPASGDRAIELQNDHDPEAFHNSLKGKVRSLYNVRSGLSVTELSVRVPQAPQEKLEQVSNADVPTSSGPGSHPGSHCRNSCALGCPSDSRAARADKPHSRGGH